MILVYKSDCGNVVAFILLKNNDNGVFFMLCISSNFGLGKSY